MHSTVRPKADRHQVRGCKRNKPACVRVAACEKFANGSKTYLSPLRQRRRPWRPVRAVRPYVGPARPDRDGLQAVRECTCDQRNGALFSLDGRKNIFNSKFKSVDAPIEENCDCYTCQTFSASYVHHLFRSKELLAYRLGSIHNLRFLVRLMEQIRDSIERGKFQTFRKEFHERFIPPNEQIRREQKLKWENSRVSR